jgi:hypothetical protein
METREARLARITHGYYCAAETWRPSMGGAEAVTCELIPGHSGKHEQFGYGKEWRWSNSEALTADEILNRISRPRTK